MEDLKKIQEFFSKPLEERMSLDDQAKAYYLAKVKRGEIDTLPEDPKAAFLAQMTKDQMDHDKETLRRERGLEENALGFSDIAKFGREAESKIDIAVRDDSRYTFGNDPYADDQLRYEYAKKMGFLEEADVDVSKDIPDIIAVDVPLFIRLLEFAREDAGDDMDLHEVAERAIEAVKARGVLSMDDYDVLVPPKKELNEDSTDDVNQMKIELAQKWLEKTPEHSNPNRGAIVSFIQMAQKDKIQANKYWVDAKLSRILDPSGQLLREIIYNNIKETIQLGKNLNEELCPKGKAYIKKRKAAGEKSSAYLSGRAVKVCKGQIKG